MDGEPAPPKHEQRNVTEICKMLTFENAQNPIIAENASCTKRNKYNGFAHAYSTKTKMFQSPARRFP